MQVPFKMYVDFEWILNSAEGYEGFCSKNIKITFLVVLLTNLLENSAYKFIEATPKEYEYCKEVII